MHLHRLPVAGRIPSPVRWTPVRGACRSSPPRPQCLQELLQRRFAGRAAADLQGMHDERRLLRVWSVARRDRLTSTATTTSRRCSCRPTPGSTVSSMTRTLDHQRVRRQSDRAGHLDDHRQERPPPTPPTEILHRHRAAASARARCGPRSEGSRGQPARRHFADLQRQRGGDDRRDRNGPRPAAVGRHGRQPYHRRGPRLERERRRTPRLWLPCDFTLVGSCSLAPTKACTSNSDCTVVPNQGQLSPVAGN